MKKVLIINGHPDELSFNAALRDAYIAGASTNNVALEVLNLSELEFDPNLQYGYRKRSDWEPDLVKAVDQIKAADHLVWIFPLWWFGLPAILKGFIDRIFLPGVMFRNVEGKVFPEGLLKGKTARIIFTSDSPWWYFRFFMRSPVIHQFKIGTLEFCGIKSVQVTHFSVIKTSNERQRKKWLNQVQQLGKNLK